MTIYTKGGDLGQTSLCSGERVAKCSPRLEAYGTVDELSSVLGWVVAALPETMPESKLLLQEIQRNLFTASSRLATSPDSYIMVKLPRLDTEEIMILENAIDAMDEELPKLKKFILPGGCEAASRLHIARTVCRRTERCVVELADGDDEQFRLICAYLNRLSDYLFTLARYANFMAGKADLEI